MSDYYDGSVRTELRRLRWLQEYAWMEAQNDDDVPDRREKLRFLQDHIVGGIENDADDAMSERDHRPKEADRQAVKEHLLRRVEIKRDADGRIVSVSVYERPKPSNWGFA